MLKHLIVTIVAVSAFAGASFAQSAVQQTPAGQATAVAKPAKVLRYLSAEDVNPALILPPPPADGSAEQKAGVAEVLAVTKAATPERMAEATWDDRNESKVIWERILAPSFKLANLPLTSALLDEVHEEGDVAVDMAKVYFGRKRPWNFDETIPLCSEKGRKGTPVRSYPSGHGVMGFTQATILASLMPEKAQQILAATQRYGFSRVVCGTHYTDDMVASQLLGTVVGKLLLQNASLKPKIEAARAELTAAGLAAK